MGSWRQLPYSNGLINEHDVQLGLLRPASSPDRSPIFSRSAAAFLGCGTPPCVLPNVQVSEGGQPVRETPLAVNPANMNQLIAGGNDSNCQTKVGFYDSGNGGSSWSAKCQTLVKGETSGIADPVVAWDLNHNVYRGAMQGGNRGYVIGVSKSRSNGSTWSPPFVAVPAYFTGGLTDKPWVQIDTNSTSSWKNTIYISVTQWNAALTSQITVSHSNDGGRTWTMVPVGPSAMKPNVNEFTDLAIDNTGTVYVSWLECTAVGSPLECAGTTATQVISRSKDGGATWSIPSTIHTVRLAPDPTGCCIFGALPKTNVRVQDIPVIAVDNSQAGKAGRLYEFDYNWTGTFMQMQVCSSTDGGATWSTPIDVAPASDTHDQFMQWLSVSRDGTVGVSWLDRRNDPNNINYEAFGSYSTDGGQHFATNFDLSAKPSNPMNDGFGGKDLGDYSGSAWAGKALYVTYPDTSNGAGAQDYLAGFLLP